MSEQNETATFEDAERGLNALQAQMDKELGIEEIFDPGHLDTEDQELLKKIMAASQAGATLPDDPTIRGMVHGAILESIGQNQ